MKSAFSVVFIYTVILSAFLQSCEKIAIKIYERKSGYSVKKLYTLPNDVLESSGVIIYDSIVWTFNDRPENQVLYGISLKSGKVKIRLNISGVPAGNWEDICQDQQNIYLGDIGNNDGDRQELRIYIIPKDSLTGQSEQYIYPETIAFGFADQTDFTQSHNNTSYDCEAIFSKDDSLFVFTKDWINNRTTLYNVPKIPGNYKLEPMDKFNSDGLVTGADYDATEKKLVICGYKTFLPFVTMFDLSGDQLPGNARQDRYNLYEYFGTQVEGVCFYKGQIYLTNEDSKRPQELLRFSPK